MSCQNYLELGTSLTLHILPTCDYLHNSHLLQTSQKFYQLSDKYIFLPRTVFKFLSSVDSLIGFPWMSLPADAYSWRVRGITYGGWRKGH